jgi:acetyl esterase/lipase
VKLRTCLAALLSLLPLPAAAQMPQFRMERIATPAQSDAIPLYPAGSLPKASVPESWMRIIGDFPDGTHRDERAARNVSVPTITPVLPDPARATGAAVIVAPGGAFLSLSMEGEGLNVARWLADHGIAAFVLKYRLNESPDDLGQFEAMIGKRMSDSIRQGGAASGVGEPRAYLDALRALKLVRDGADTWRIDPRRVGIIGFSAGAMTALQSVLTGDAAERPNFVGYIYGPMVAVPAPAGAPPLFAALALDDPLFGRQGFGIIDSWRKAGSPIELHAYQRGDHGFGMGVRGTTTVLVMDEFRLWLESNGFLRPRAGK